MKGARVSKETLERIVQATDIVQLVSGYVTLKPSGKNFLGLCPFHSERTPSFNVSPGRQNYHCFGCGAHGDPIRFVMEMEHLSFLEAVKDLAGKTGIALGLEAPAEEKPILNELSRCLEEAQSFFRQNLVQAGVNSVIRGYLQRRRLSDASIEAFQLGFVGPGWTQIYDRLTQRGVATEILEACGLIKQGEKGGYYDRLRDRLIFPIRDLQGRLLGFAGRVIGEGTPKYLNPPETELYKKSSTFYGVFEAHRAIRKARRAILVEGYLDVLRLHEKGWNEAIASCGTALNEDHIRALKRLGVPELVLLFDGDKAGQKAAEKSAALLMAQGLDSKVLILPDGLDPDDFFKSYGATDFERLLREAPQDFDFLLDVTQRQSSGLGLEAQKQAIDGLIALVQKLPSPVKRDLMRAKLGEVFHLGERALQSLPKPAQRPLIALPSQGATAFAGIFRSHAEEANLLAYLLSYPEGLEVVAPYLTFEDFAHPNLRILYRRLASLPQEDLREVRATEFADLFIEQKDWVMALLQGFKGYAADTYTPGKVRQYLRSLKKKLYTRLVDEIRNAEKRADQAAYDKASLRKNEVQKLLRSLDPRTPQPSMKVLHGREERK